MGRPIERRRLGSGNRVSPPSTCGKACFACSGDNVLSGSAARSTRGRCWRPRCPVVRRIRDPGLQRGPGPCADAAAQMHGRREAPGGDAPIECRTRQGRHSDDIPDAVVRRNNVRSAIAIALDCKARNHRRKPKVERPRGPGFRRRLRGPNRLRVASRRPPTCLDSQLAASQGRERLRRSRRLTAFVILRIRQDAAITQRSRRVRRTRSCVHKSSWSGGTRSCSHSLTTIGVAHGPESASRSEGFASSGTPGASREVFMRHIVLDHRVEGSGHNRGESGGTSGHGA